MKKRILAALIVVLAILAVGVLAVYLSGSIAPIVSNPTPTPTQTSSTTSPNPTIAPSPTATASNPISPIVYTYKILNTYPHDANAFTEGLVYDNGVLYESTGNYGTSSLRKVNLETGAITQEFLLPDQFFGEGLAMVGNSLVQLTWMEHIGFVYNKETFAMQGNFSYSTEGWGLTFNGTHLIMSDGTSNLYFLDSNTYQVMGQISVHDGNRPIVNLNELEYINGTIYANIWLTQQIVLINPQTGQVTGYIDLTGIYQSSDPNAVLNGIAYDSATDRLFVTGKDWPYLYQIEIIRKPGL